MVEEALRVAYREAIGVTKTTEGNASVLHGVVVDKTTNRFMATYCLGPNNGSLCKIFATREDADYWFDSMECLMSKGRLKNNLAVLRKAEATRKATAAAIDARCFVSFLYSKKIFWWTLNFGILKGTF